MSANPQFPAHPHPDPSTAPAENPTHTESTPSYRWKAARSRRAVAAALEAPTVCVKGSPVRPETIRALLHRWIPSPQQFENVESFASRCTKKPPVPWRPVGAPAGSPDELAGGCWVFRTSEALYAYPSFRDSRNGGSWHSAYIWLYETLHGPLMPDFPCIDHKCENKRCVNPDHLQAVTRSENVLASKRRAAERERERLAGVLARSPSLALVKGQGT